MIYNYFIAGPPIYALAPEVLLAVSRNTSKQVIHDALDYSEFSGDQTSPLDQVEPGAEKGYHLVATVLTWVVVNLSN